MLSEAWADACVRLWETLEHNNQTALMDNATLWDGFKMLYLERVVPETGRRARGVLDGITD